MFPCIDIQAQTFVINSGNMPKLYLVMSDIAVFRMCTVPLPFLAVSKCKFCNTVQTTKKSKE